jgi:hypothetical protein
LSTGHTQISDQLPFEHLATGQTGVTDLAFETNQLASLEDIPARLASPKILPPLAQSEIPPALAILPRQTGDKDSAVEINQSAAPEDIPLPPTPQNISATAPVSSNPPSPAHTQLSESTLEYLPTSQTFTADFAPGSVSDLSDSAWSDELPTHSFGDQIDSPLVTPSPLPKSYLLQPAIDLHPLLETNNQKTPPNANLMSLADPNMSTELTSSPTRNSAKKRLIVHDSEDDSRPSSVVGDALPAAIASPIRSAPPPAAVAAPINLQIAAHNPYGFAHANVRATAGTEGKQGTNNGKHCKLR